ncbi:YceI family protein [Stenotrophomonas sp. YIM B06876]|uniref:YceI family protein n=1 Tax=Stenotrophomonas sp. YIM B06876 TaxID=3060211 RepID=UPI0027382897|nr:YceI family protein [Stenotrophomonas sp. YIM B06876]
MNIRLTTPTAVAAALTAMLAASPVSAADYLQAPGSTLVFASKYDGEVFTGTFPGFATRLSFDPGNLEASELEVTIPLAGTRTGNGDRDATLQGSDFFNVAKFATAHYRARNFRALGNNHYVAEGTLELRGISKPVTLTFTWTPGAQPVLSGKATVKRLDFGVGSGDWADPGIIPNETAISTRVVFRAR